MSRGVLASFAALLVAAAGATVPTWTEWNHYEALASAASLGLANAAALPPTVLLVPLALLALGAAGASLAARGKAWRSRAVFAAAWGFALWLLVGTTSETARRRSNAVDTWPICETKTTVFGTPAYISDFKSAPYFDGPHLEDGSPCSLAAERRDQHAMLEPDGDVVDGVQQVVDRFREDRVLVLVVAPASLAALLLAGALILAATRGAPPLFVDPRRRRRASIAAIVVGSMMMAGAFAGYDMGDWLHATTRLCYEARYGRTLDGRREALARGTPRVTGLMNVLPEKVMGSGWDCRAAAAELDALSSRHECPYEVVDGVPCTCGAEAYPYARCEKPQCPPITPPRFRCAGDSW